MTTSERKIKPPLPYSEELTRALRLAKQEAQEFGHDNYGTIHLLFGLSQEPSAKEILAGFGITVDKIQEMEPFQYNNHRNQAPNVQLSERAVMVMELAANEAASTGAQEILPIHVVIGLILASNNMKSNGPAVQLMEQLSRKNSRKLLAELRTIS